MKTLLLSAFIVSNILTITPTFAGNESGGRDLPIRLSAKVISAVTNKILSDRGFEFYSISKIKVRENSVKVQLTNEAGECLAVPYLITINSLGEPEAEVNTAALAICD